MPDRILTRVVGFGSLMATVNSHEVTMFEGPIGIAGVGVYLPEGRMTAADVAAKTQGTWTEDAVRNKLGFDVKPTPGPDDGTQQMAVWAAERALKDANLAADDVDLILCIGEEYKEFGLTTSGIFVQEQLGAKKAWAVDVQQRCNSTIAALKMAKSMMLSDDDLDVVLICGGYRNGDLVDYTDAGASFMYNLGAGAGALVLKKNLDKNIVLGSHIITDGSMSRDVGVRLLGTTHPIESLDDDTVAKLRKEGNATLQVFDAPHMKERLNAVSMDNWMRCLDVALKSSGHTRDDIAFLNILHFKPSMFRFLLGELGLTEEQAVYLDQTGHVGQIDPMIVIEEGRRTGRLKDGDVMAILSAGIGYVWGASVIRWG